jgi:hypothetical protein
MPQTYQVTCSECGELRWPYLPERPDTYVCVRCQSGVGAAKREAGPGRRLRGESRAVASYRQQQRPPRRHAKLHRMTTLVGARLPVLNLGNPTS